MNRTAVRLRIHAVEHLLHGLRARGGHEVLGVRDRDLVGIACQFPHSLLDERIERHRPAPGRAGADDDLIPEPVKGLSQTLADSRASARDEDCVRMCSHTLLTWTAPFCNRKLHPIRESRPRSYHLGWHRVS